MKNEWFLSDFYMKKIGKMIQSEKNNGVYELNPKFAPKLLDLGLIIEAKWPMAFLGAICSCSGYFVTDKGRKVYQEWLDDQLA